MPIDDTCHWKYVFMFSREKALSKELRMKHRADVSPDYRLSQEAANRYQQDRDSMQTKTFTGMGLNFQAHDAFATESQGTIQDRTSEHLVTSDKAIVAARTLYHESDHALSPDGAQGNWSGKAKRSPAKTCVQHAGFSPWIAGPEPGHAPVETAKPAVEL